MVNLAFLLAFCLALQLGVLEASSPRVKDMKARSLDQIFAETNAGTQGMTKDGNILVEYDVALSPRQYRALYQTPLGHSKRAITRRRVRSLQIWPNNRMPYEIANNGFNSRQRDDIMKAFREIESFTCLKIEPRTARDTDYVFVDSSDYGCHSRIGLERTGRQNLNLAMPECYSKGTFIHEAMHSLGVIHEHCMWNRGNFLNVYKENAKAKFAYNLDLESRAMSKGRENVPYSYKSLMHYSVTAFTKNGAATLYPKDASKVRYIEPGYDKPMSYSDVHVLNSMYKCADKCSAADKNKCGRSGHLGKDCKCICEDGSQDCDSKNPSKSRCKNAFVNSWDCFRWAADGECNKFKTWMSKYCASTCNTCNRGLRTTETCINAEKNDKKCENWANSNECTANPGFMKGNCAKACKKCNYKPPLTIKCDVDEYGPTQCEAWAKSGECQKNPVFMMPNCRKSCKTCDEGAKLCDNTYGDDKACKEWADRGECEVNPRFMKVKCANECKTC